MHEQRTHLSLFMINHNIVWFNIPVHDPFAVAEIQRLEKLVDVEPYIIINKSRVQCAEVCVVDILEYQAGCLALAVPHNIEKSYDIWTTRQVLQDFDLSFYLLFLDGFQDLDNTFLVVCNVYAFKNFAVLPTA